MRSLIVFLLTLLVAVTGAAQVVQPSYVRQSKSAQVQVFTAAQTSSVGVVTFDSAVIETTSFNSVQLFVDFDILCSGDLIVLFSLNKTGPFIQATQSSPNSFKDLDDIDSSPALYNVSNIAPYIKFRFDSMGCPNGLNASATLVPFPSNVTVQGDKSNRSFPVPTGVYGYPLGTTLFQVSGAPDGQGLASMYVSPKSLGGSNTSPVTVSNLSATTVYSNAGNDLTVILQNQGTVPVRCGISAVTAADYQFALKASTVAGDGTGGVQSIVKTKNADLNCIAVGSPGSVSVIAY